MKAVVLNKHGGLDELKYVTDFPDPKVIDGHVVIRVGATSFNYHDVFTVRGMPGIKVPLPMIIGLDLAGEILEVGPGVSGVENRRPRAGQPAQQAKGADGRDDARRARREMPGGGRPADPHAGQGDRSSKPPPSPSPTARRTA